MSQHESIKAAQTGSNLRKNLGGAFLSIAVIAAIYGFALPLFADYGDVWDTITEMTRLEVSTLVLVAAFNLWTYLPLLTSVLPGLKQRQAFVVNNSSTAVSNTMPGGGAFGVAVTYAMYRSWGFDKVAIGLSVVVSGIWNTLVKLGLPILALAVLLISGDATTALLIASLIGVAILIAAIALFSMVLNSEQLARRLGEASARLITPILLRLRRPTPSRWGERFADFRASITDLVAHRWPRITLATVVSHITLFFVLLVALRHVGVDNGTVGWATVLASFAFGRLVTAIPVTPGGLGVIELGYVAALSVGVGDAVETKIVAAVLLFRAITFAPPIVIGGLTYLYWRRNKSWRNPQVTTPNDYFDRASAT